MIPITSNRRFSSRSLSESLEPRRLLCGIPHNEWVPAPEWSDEIEAAAHQGPEGGAANIVWANRGQASDGFATNFGTSATAGRAVVDAVIQWWEKVITSFNRADATTTLQIDISMHASNTGFGAAGGPDSNAPADGKPRTGSITINRGTPGADPNDSNGYFFDPDPEDSAEFQGDIINAFAGADSAGVGSDFFSLVSAEMAHVLGLISDKSNDGNGWQGYLLENYVTNTGIRDNAEGGGNYGYFYTFDGPGIDHLMTSYNSGDATSSSWGNAVHTAGGAGNINFDGKNWRGSEDTGNAIYGNERTRPSYVMANILEDAYGYSITQPDTFETFYTVWDSSTGNVNVRGGDYHVGHPVSNDKFYISHDGSDVIIGVDVPTDVPGTYNLSGAGDFPTWSTRIPIADVNTITIDAEQGDDDIYIYGVPSGVNVVVNAGAGNDFIQIGNGDVDNTLIGNVTVNGGAGTDSLSYFDLLDDIGNDDYLITSTTIDKDSLTGLTTYSNTDMESISISANGLDNDFDISSIAALPIYYLNGFAGNDRFIAAVDFDTYIDGSVNCIGGTGTDRIIIDDTADPLDDEYLLTGNRFEKVTFGDGQVFASNTTEEFEVTLNPDNNFVNIPQVSPWLSVTVRGGDGDDDFSVANNNMDVNLPGGPVRVEGGAGTDSLVISDAADTGDDDYTLSNTQLNKSGAHIINYFTFESFNLDLNSGSNTIDVLSTFSNCPYTIDGNNGDDIINVNDGTSFLFNFGSDIAFNGNAGDDQVNITDSGFAGIGNYTITNGHVVLPFNSMDVFFNTTETLFVNGSQGANTINVNQTSILTLISGDDGDDIINVGNNNWDANITADVLVLGGGGNDFAYFQDANDTGNDTYTITTGSVAKNSSAARMLTSFFGPTIDNVWIQASNADHTFNVESIGSNTTDANLLISAGGGADTTNITPTSQVISDLDGNVTVNGDAGNDVLNMYDFNDAGGDTTTLAGGLTKSDWTHVINYNATATNETINLFGSNAASTTQMIGSPAANFTINANGGADVIDIDGNNTTFPITVMGGAGLDDLRVNDDAVGNATVVLVTDEDLGLMSIGAGGLLTVAQGADKTLDVGGVNMLTGRLNLNDNYFIRRGPGVSFSFYNTRLTNGYNGGAWNGVEPSFISSTAASAINANDALGIAIAGEVGVANFGGVAVGASDLLIGYTLYGDTDLNRSVNFNDLLRVAQNYGLAGNWSKGDFNYNGTINFEDLLKLAQTYNQSIVTSINPAVAPRSSILNSREDDKLFGLM